MGLKKTFFGMAAGFIISGPIGAILGAVVGSLLPDSQSKIDEGKTHTSEFTYSLLILIAVIIKADHEVKKSEILFVKDYFIQKFGKDSAQEMMNILRELLKQNINQKEVCEQIRLNTDYYFRQELIHLLFEIGAADGEVDSLEFTIIRDIAANFSIGQLDFVRIAAMYYENTANFKNRQGYNQKEEKILNDYTILGISPDSDKEAIKKAFRKLSLEYHPDKVAHLGTEYQQIAHEKFIKIKDSYDRLMAIK